MYTDPVYPSRLGIYRNDVSGSEYTKRHSVNESFPRNCRMSKAIFKFLLEAGKNMNMQMIKKRIGFI
jgi:hypothetical protein